MPTLPSGKELAISTYAIVDFAGRTDWFHCARDRFWFLTPDLHITPAPYGADDAIAMNFFTAPLPESRNEAMEYIMVLHGNPDRGMLWKGEWLSDFLIHNDLDASDMDAFTEWLGSHVEYLDNVVTCGLRQPHHRHEMSGRFLHYTSEHQFMMAMRSSKLSNVIDESRIGTYNLSALFEQRHMLPRAIRAEDYRLALKVVTSALVEEGRSIDGVSAAMATPCSILTADEHRPLAIKVKASRSGEPAELSAHEVRMIEEWAHEHQATAAIALVSFHPAGYSVESGNDGFYVRYSGITILGDTPEQ